MKTKNLLMMVLCGITLNVYSQSYTLSVSTASYSDLVGSTSLNKDMTWDDPQFTIPIGFNFQYFNTTMDNIFMTSWGYGGELTSDSLNSGVFPLLVPYGADIIDRGYDFDVDSSTIGSLSTISYLLEGTQGNRILKIEWKNVGFYSEMEDDGISTDFTNFQLWLYEGSNDIEIHFGPNSITQPNLSFDGETGAYVGLFPAFDFDDYLVIGNGYELIGNPSSPTMITVNDNNSFTNFLEGVIPNGTSYKFSNSAVGLSELNSNSIEISIYPNPSSDVLYIAADNAKWELESLSIVNINGQIVKEIDQVNGAIDISYLKSGIYYIYIQTLSGVEIYKLIKN